MKTIAFYIQKGGVGKTTTSTNVGWLLSQRGKTLLVDADPQGNTTTLYLTERPQYELADVLQGKIEVDEAILQIKENFYIMPTFGIDGNLKNYSETILNQEPFIFQDLCDSVKKLDYDYMVFDLSPGMSKLETSVLLACDEVITPLTPEIFSIDGIAIFRSELEKIKKNWKVSILHEKILCNNINLSFNIHKEALEALQKTNYSVYVLPQSMDVKKSQEANMSIFQYNSNSKSLEYYKKLVEAI